MSQSGPKTNAFNTAARLQNENAKLVPNRFSNRERTREAQKSTDAVWQAAAKARRQRRRRRLGTKANKLQELQSYFYDFLQASLHELVRRAFLSVPAIFQSLSHAAS